SINDFVTGQPALFYERGFSLLPGSGVGDDSSGAAEFNLWQLGLYVQDDIQFTDNFRMSIGLRFDMPIWEDGLANDDFNNRTIPLLEAAGKDLQGARVGQGIDNKVHVSPRLGFNWDVFGNKTTQVRGGLGVFTSRLPLVWPGATYNNNGVTGGFSSDRDFDDPIFFNPDVNNQPTSVEPGTGAVAGNVDLFAKDFKLPQRFRTSIAVDQKLPIWGLVVSADYMYNDNISDIFYENLNIRGPVGFLNGADNRPFFDRRDRIDATYGSIILASNTSKGYSWNSTFTIRKPYQNGFQGQVAWSFGRSEAIFDGTSSQNTSQWRNIQTVNGKNSNLPVTFSDFNQGHRLTSFVSYDFEWLKNFKTTIGFFYEGFEGTPFSYIYSNRRTNLLNDDSRDNALMFVPSNLGQINLVDNSGAPITDVNHPDWILLNNFIENDSYLRSKRGQYVERNGDQGPWSHIIDLRLVQDFSLKLGNNKHAFQFTADMFNFTNFLNKDWGKRKFVPGNVSILQTESGGPDPTFSVIRSTLERGVEQLDDAGIASSRWQLQLGLRYLFN
ncbi:MAG: TonB-dependent receptor, partial [Flavobacteriaceae bacterium]|nr:TonB-dependent receptor [Flavobacteriaceae bacterium]